MNPDRGRRLLLVLPQLPHDPASGAARSMRTIAEMLGTAGFHVRALATTSTERSDPTDAVRLLTSQSVQPSESKTDPGDCRVFQFDDRNVSYQLLDTAQLAPDEWEEAHGTHFTALFARELREHSPDILFTFGGGRNDMHRRRLARAAGAKVVFGLRNHSYMHPAAFIDVDAVLTPSQFLSDRYARHIGLVSTPLPTPIESRDVLAPTRDAVFLTFINPTVEKGVMLFARLAEELSVARPDIPILVVESRGNAGALTAAGLRGGFDLRRHRNIMISPGVARPADIYAVTRILVVPSVWEEPSGRVAAEALFNGIPVIASERGGLPETCGSGGLIIPLPNDLQPHTIAPVSAEAVRPWIAAILPLIDEPHTYAAATQRASAAGLAVSPQSLSDRYVSFFETVGRCATPIAHVSTRPPGA